MSVYEQFLKRKRLFFFVKSKFLYDTSIELSLF